MDINEAYEILQLSIGATKEEIEKQFKKLSLKRHPDHGGTNEEFVALSKAKEIASVYFDNKALIIVANHLVSQEFSMLQKNIETNEQIKVAINRIERLERGRMQRYKDLTLIMTLVSGLFVLLGNIQSNVLFKEMFASESLKQVMLVFGAVLGVLFLFLNFYTNRLKDKIDELKDLFDNKEELHIILFDIFRGNLNKKFEREEIYDLIKERFLGITDNPAQRISDIHNTMKNVILTGNMPIKSLVRFVGYKDFGRLLLLKAVSNKQVEEIESISNHNLKLKYRLKTNRN